MSTTYDANNNPTGPLPPLPPPHAAPSRFHDLPDIYAPRRHRFPLALVAGGMFIVTAVGFYSAEAFLPPKYKPSRFIGGYQKEIARARAEGELAARISYDARFKLIETDAVRWQERCRAGLQNANNLYQAAYTRANMFAQTTAELQKQYASVRYSIAQQSVGGDLAAANMGSLFGYLASLFDPETGQRSMAFAEQARQQALQKLDDAARSGVTVSVEGWNTGLPDPASLPAANACELPASLGAPQPSSKG